MFFARRIVFSRFFDRPSLAQDEENKMENLERGDNNGIRRLLSHRGIIQRERK